MKILSATVTDPRRGGEYRNPFLTLEVDEEVNETGEPTMKDGWRITPHGPFAAVDYWKYSDEGGEWGDADLGLFNTTGLHRDKLVEVLVYSPREEIDLAMSVARARRLLRKHSVEWRYTMDDVAGQHGKVAWRLMAFGLPTCVKCDAPMKEEVFYRQTYLPYCSTHLSEHNLMIRNMRTRTA